MAGSGDDKELSHWQELTCAVQHRKQTAMFGAPPVTVVIGEEAGPVLRPLFVNVMAATLERNCGREEKRRDCCSFHRKSFD